MKTSKLISKFQKYWLVDAYFRELIYTCIESIRNKNCVYLNSKNYYHVLEKYSDLHLSDYEISIFLSANLFNYYSRFGHEDRTKFGYFGSDKSEEIKNKNHDFFVLGQKTGLGGQVIKAISYTANNPNFPTQNLLAEMRPNFPDRDVSVFVSGFKNELLPEILTEEETFFYLAGVDAADNSLVQFLKSKNVFNHLE